MSGDTETIKNHFEKTCPQKRIGGRFLFHGSPPEGVKEILAANRIIAPRHEELGMRLFSTSTNETVLDLFSERTLSGFCFFPNEESIDARELSRFYYALLAGNTSQEAWRNHIKESPDDEALAEDLGLMEYRAECRLDKDYFLSELKGHTEALLFPHWDSEFQEIHPTDWRGEREVAFFPKGCKKLWQAIEKGFLNGEEIPKRNTATLSGRRLFYKF